MMTVTVPLRYFLGQVKTDKGILQYYVYVHMVVVILFTLDKNVYKLPDTTLFVKSVEMKFKVSIKIQWFESQKKLWIMD